MQIHNHCKLFKGDMPCKPHKETSVHCLECTHYQPFKERILIIKLGAAGDVIRTTPILHELRNQYPHAKIYWLTLTPILVPTSMVDVVCEWSLDSVIWLQSIPYDIMINLDKDHHALALAKKIQAKKKYGYTMDDFGNCIPINQNASSKWLTGLFDDLCMQNKKSYPEELFEICDLTYQKQTYLMELPKIKDGIIIETDKKIIGLNTGCGTRWQTRLWGEDNWIQLANQLDKDGYLPLLLGGPQEHDLNLAIANKSKAIYKGYFELGQFLHIVNQCIAVVTSVTMTLHIAIALNKKIILLNNIFNKNEFELYGLGVLLEPDNKDCLGCYKNSCPLECMSAIPVSLVHEQLINQINKSEDQ